MAWGFAPWKRELVQRNFPEFDFRFVSLAEPRSAWQRRHEKRRDAAFVIWGYQESEELRAYAEERNVPLYRMEDGFVRSVGLGAAHAVPRSLVLDRTGHLYYDASAPSALEQLCQSYDFGANPDLLQEAEACRQLILEAGVSKYNHASTPARVPFERAGSERVLVIGQVEDDASILRGRAGQWTNALMAEQARKENPGAEIIFKPHPDFLHGHTAKRAAGSSLEEVVRFARVLFEDMPLSQVLPQFHRVYTMTSLAGFEAMLRGIPVTVLGYPFYAGWGLSDDRQTDARRSRKLDLIELFAAAYLLYPLYFDPETGAPSTLRNTIIEIAEERRRGA